MVDRIQPKILYLQFMDPAAYPPLEHSSQILAKQGWQVLFLGVQRRGRKTLEFPPHSNIRVRRLCLDSPGWWQKFQYVGFCFWAVIWAILWKPQWVYASDLLSCPVALLLSYLPKARVIYHEHDSFPPAATLFLRLCLWARRALAQRVHSCILPNKERAARFKKETGTNHKVLCVWNCPRQEEVSRSRSSELKKPLRLYYHGNLSSDLLPPTVLEAVARAGKDVQLFIIGYGAMGHKDYVTQLKERSARLGIDKQVRFFDTIPRYQLWELMGQCDVGLALMPKRANNPNFQMMIGASNKPFDYLAGGLALLVSDFPDWKKTYVDPGYGLACDPADPQSIARALRWFLDHPAETRAMGERARQRILSEWNYEKQFSPVFKQINGNNEEIIAAASARHAG